MQDNLIKCPTCGDHFNPAYLDQVIEHTHSGIWFDQTIKGERVMGKSMIKSNELRMGNYVYNPEPIGVIVKIDASAFEFLEQIEKGEPFAGNYLCIPIPLTPEILEKCGFERKKQIFTKQGPPPISIKIDFQDREPLLFFCVNDDGYKEISIIHVYHLHQIQNLYFALTGEELTVNL